MMGGPGRGVFFFGWGRGRISLLTEAKQNGTTFICLFELRRRKKDTPKRRFFKECK